MEHLKPSQQRLLASLLSGKSISEAAKDSKLSYSWAWQLANNKDPNITQAFYDELQKQLGEQMEYLLQEAGRSKDALLEEWEELRDACREGETKYTKEGYSYQVRDLPTWGKTLIERGKLLQYYVNRLELEDKTPEKRKRRDLSKLTRQQRLQLQELELLALVDDDEAEE